MYYMMSLIPYWMAGWLGGGRLMVTLGRLHGHHTPGSFRDELAVKAHPSTRNRAPSLPPQAYGVLRLHSTRSNRSASWRLQLFWTYSGPQIRRKRGENAGTRNTHHTRQGQARLHTLYKMQVSEALLSVKSPSPVYVCARSCCGNASPAQISA